MDLITLVVQVSRYNVILILHFLTSKLDTRYLSSIAIVWFPYFLYLLFFFGKDEIEVPTFSINK